MPLLQNQKRIMALAGVFMTAFLVIHVLSNLTLFSSNQTTTFYDWYLESWIRWPVVIMFVLSLACHVVVAVRIRRQNFQARTVQYAKHDSFHVPPLLVTVAITLLFLFIAFHLFQTLTLTDNSSVSKQVREWFNSVWMVFIYLSGITVLSMHLMHALINVLQTLAITSKQYIAYVAVGVSLLFIGFSSVPVVFYWSQL